MRQTRVPPNVTRSTKLRGAQFTQIYNLLLNLLLEAQTFHLRYYERV